MARADGVLATHMVGVNPDEEIAAYIGDGKFGEGDDVNIDAHDAAQLLDAHLAHQARIDGDFVFGLQPTDDVRIGKVDGDAAVSSVADGKFPNRIRGSGSVDGPPN